MLVAVRAAVGPSIQLRADANRAWKLHEATAFASAACEATLQVSRPPRLGSHQRFQKSKALCVSWQSACQGSQLICPRWHAHACPVARLGVPGRVLSMGLANDAPSAYIFMPWVKHQAWSSCACPSFCCMFTLMVVRPCPGPHRLNTHTSQDHPIPHAAHASCCLCRAVPGGASAGSCRLGSLARGVWHGRGLG